MSTSDAAHSNKRDIVGALAAHHHHPLMITRAWNDPQALLIFPVQSLLWTTSSQISVHSFHSRATKTFLSFSSPPLFILQGEEGPRGLAGPVVSFPDWQLKSHLSSSAQWMKLRSNLSMSVQGPPGVAGLTGPVGLQGQTVPLDLEL